MPIRDPLLRQIEAALDLPLDGNIFEATMCSMFREQRIYPKIVPVRGGGDAGMDGAIGDPSDGAQPIPLVCTTQEDVKANLVGSLRSYKKKIGARSVVVSATSRALTPAMQRDLAAAASAEGFTLLNIYERTVVAEMLHRSPRWCKELLGLTAVRPSLSAFPQDGRPFIDQPLRGRDDDMTWLKSQTGDILISGQSGIGKTFLLRAYATGHDALFAVTDDVAAIEAGIREEQPRVVIVTDAHARPGLLQSLRQLRADTGGTWRILADCWPGAEKDVRQELLIATANARTLSLLSRDTIVEIIKDAKLAGPVRLLREIVDQARGRAGLAVTLTWMCLNGDYARVGLGQALAEQIEANFKSLVGAASIDILALLSLGGDYGVPLAVAATALGQPEAQLQRMIVSMAAGGVVEEGGKTDGTTRIVVQPAALREALVSERFFSSFAIGIPDVVSQCVPAGALADVLLGARHRGGSVPDTLLWSLIIRNPTQDLLKSYAGLGKDQAGYVLAQQPDHLLGVAPVGLLVAPSAYVPALLTRAIGDMRATHSYTNHPLRIIEDWVHGGRPGEDAIPRRRALVDAIGRWLKEGGDADTAVRAFALALVPAFTTSHLDPGAGNTVTITRGVMRAEEVNDLLPLWHSSLTLLHPDQVRNWRPLIDAVGVVASPYVFGGSPGDDVRAACLRVAADAITEMADICASRPGVVLAMSRLAKRLGFQFTRNADLEFTTLYPEDDWEDYEAGWKRAMDAARELVKRLVQQSPGEVAAKLAAYAAEADAAGLRNGIIPHIVGCTLAEDVQRRGEWLAALRDAGCSADYLAPVLTEMFQADRGQWLAACEACWAKMQLRRMVAMDVLSREYVPPGMMEKVIAWLPEDPDIVEIQCLRGLVALPALKRLLSHADAEVASESARGEWHRAKPGGIRPELAELWRAAIVRSPTRSKRDRRTIGIGDILSNDAELAFSWMMARIREGTPLYLIEDYDFDKATPALSADQRYELLLVLAQSKVYAPSDVVVRLVNRDAALYRRVLSAPAAKRIHLVPLADRPTGGWAALAALALDAGYSAEQVQQVPGERLDWWSGPESEHWDQWLADWAALKASPDPRLHAVAALGIREAEERRAAARRKEQQEGVVGR